jgi:ribosomal protein S18 acetylase RimI-like enzyme
VLPGLTGPTGGPAMTDVLGVMESWTRSATVVRPEQGDAVEIALGDIVSGKPVPPRASPRLRVPAEEVCRLTNGSWPAAHTEPLGAWLLRASGGFSARANSVMATGDPGVPLPAALDRVRAFYTGHGLPAWAQVVVGSGTHRLLEDDGWVGARPGEADSELQLVSVAQAARAVRRLRPDDAAAEVVDHVDPAWLATDERAREHGRDALAVLEGPDQVGFARVVEDGAVVARGRIAAVEDWAGITDVWVSADRRRRGLALTVLDALLSWAAERGATTAYLQVRGDNAPALALYGRLGFRTHHTYRYLSEP